MPISNARPLLSLILLLRRAGEDKFSPEQQPIAANGSDAAQIRCPHCRWRPTCASRWTCWDCDYPEFFYGGCGSLWNTFETKGLCPTCRHQWKWTACLRCGGWALHQDWYE